MSTPTQERPMVPQADQNQQPGYALQAHGEQVDPNLDFMDDAYIGGQGAIGLESPAAPTLPNAPVDQHDGIGEPSVVDGHAETIEHPVIENPQSRHESEPEQSLQSKWPELSWNSGMQSVDGFAGQEVGVGMLKDILADGGETPTSNFPTSEVYIEDDQGNIFAIVKPKQLFDDPASQRMPEDQWVIIDANATAERGQLHGFTLTDDDLRLGFVEQGGIFHYNYSADGTRQQTGSVHNITLVNHDLAFDEDEQAIFQEHNAVSDIRSRFWNRVGQEAPRPVENVPPAPVGRPRESEGGAELSPEEKIRREIFSRMGFNILGEDNELIMLNEHSRQTFGPRVLDARFNDDGELQFSLKVFITKMEEAQGIDPEHDGYIMDTTLSLRGMLDMLKKSDERWLAIDPDTISDETQRENTKTHIEGAMKRQAIRERLAGSGDPAPAPGTDPAPSEPGPAGTEPPRGEQEKPRRFKNLRGAAKKLLNRVTFNRFARNDQEARQKLTKRERLVAAGLGIAAVAAGYAVYKGFLDHDSAEQVRQIHKSSVGGNGDLASSLQEQAQGRIDAAAITPDADTVSQASDVARGWTDTVKPGEGITYTFGDYLQAKGVNASPDQLYDAFEKARSAGLMTPENISGISPQSVQGGVGFDGAGQTRLSPELVQFLNQQFNIR